MIGYPFKGRAMLLSTLCSGKRVTGSTTWENVRYDYILADSRARQSFALELVSLEELVKVMLVISYDGEVNHFATIGGEIVDGGKPLWMGAAMTDFLKDKHDTVIETKIDSLIQSIVAARGRSR